MKCLKMGVPVGVFFQSLAGSQKGNEAFGISVEMLDEAYELIKKHSTCRGPNYFYFETGQGSELSSDSHHGADQSPWKPDATALQSAYKPLIVNTVVGFIGPEYLYDSKQVIPCGLRRPLHGQAHRNFHGR